MLGSRGGTKPASGAPVKSDSNAPRRTKTAGKQGKEARTFGSFRGQDLRTPSPSLNTSHFSTPRAVPKVAEGLEERAVDLGTHRSHYCLGSASALPCDTAPLWASVSSFAKQGLGFPQGSSRLQNARSSLCLGSER